MRPMYRRPVALLTFSLLFFTALPSLAQFPVSPNAYDEQNLRTGYWTILLDSTDKVVTNPDSVVVYRIIRFEKGKPVGKVRDFYRTYSRQWDGYLSSVNPDIKDGETNYYFENGKVHYHGFYKNNLLQGPFQEFYDKGPLLAEGLMKNDTSEGQWTIYFPSGAKSYVSQRVKGVEHGDFEDYYESGQLSAKGKKVNGQKSGFWIEYHANGQVAMHENFVDGKLDGPYKFWNPNGILESDGPFKDGSKNGVWNEYYDTGEKQATGEYVDGQKNGWWKLFNKNGKLKTEGNQVNGLQQGFYTFYYEHGTISAKGNLVNSLYDSTWIFYNPDGTLKRQADYLRDSLNGFCIYYREDGTKKSEGSYIMDKKNGVWKYFDKDLHLTGAEEYVKDVLTGDNLDYYSNGQLKRKRSYVNGLKQGENLEYHQDGTPRCTGFYKDDKMEGAWKWYYPNGQLESSYTYVNDLYEGPWTNYHDNGKVESVGQAIHGKREGLIRFYHRTGLLEKEGKSVAGKDEGRWTTYDSLTGKKTSDGHYLHHKLDGRWKFYEPNGKLKSISYYKNGFFETRSNIIDSLDRLIVLGEYDLAQKEVEWLSRVIKRDYPKNSKYTSSPFYYYASVAIDKEDYASALTWYEKYEKNVKLLEGDTVKNYEVALNGIALAKMNLGRSNEALPLYDRVIAMSSRDDNDYGIGVSNKAIALSKIGRTEEGAEILEKEYAVMKKEKGDTSRLAMNVLWLLGNYYYIWAGNNEKALTAYKEFYQQLNKNSKRTDPRVIQCMRQIGLCFKSDQQRKEAINWFIKELELSDSLHLNITSTINYLDDLRSLAGLYTDTNQYDTALVLYGRMSNLIVATGRLGTLPHARVLEGRANVEYYHDEYDKAIESWKEAIAIFEKIGATKGTYYTGALSGIGFCINYSGSNTAAEAEPYFLKALSVTLQNQGENSAQYQRLLTNTANFYRSNKQFLKADSLMRKK
ncbi:MAG: hypothetical protein WDN75_12850 [Bacteroidota bacterium]